MENKNSFGGLWDDKKCFDYEMANQIRLDNEGFVNMFRATAKQIAELVEFKTFADIGGGVGTYSLAMKELNKHVTYYDLNRHHFDYASLHNVANTYIKCDITDIKIKADLVACIEVMEHITDDKLHRMLGNIECKYFHFSSTPNTTTWDAEWGHINIKQEAEWIALFKEHNYELLTQIEVPTTWSLLFKKV
jgi:2-polyprenyl-3-methyl-5-hydroxy-6-metoxy-1,4-benzoquinol methylase